MNFLETISPLSDDPIFGLYAAFRADLRPHKINLAIGIYMDEKGKVPLLASVHRAEQSIMASGQPKAYLPIEGHPQLLKETLQLVYGDSSDFLAVQCLGGTGGLRIGADFLKSQGLTHVFLSDPSWPNHNQIFEQAGFSVGYYPYYDKGLNFEGMCAALRQMAPNSIVVLQVCCHNPTGIDLSLEQWEEVEKIVKKGKLFPFFDFAYQGLGEGLDVDAAPVRLFAKKGHLMMVSSSFSKNFGLYGERVGVLSIANAPTAVVSHLRRIIRSSYSNPSLHGATIVATILQTPELKTLWQSEVAGMQQRLLEMRQKLCHKLHGRGHGLFMMSGLNAEQVARLREKEGIYLLENGRLNLAGLNETNLDIVLKAL